jgi:hypothetical protein
LLKNLQTPKQPSAPIGHHIRIQIPDLKLPVT